MRKVKVKGIRKSIVLSIAIMFFAIGTSALADSNWDDFKNNYKTNSTSSLNTDVTANGENGGVSFTPPVPGSSNKYVMNGNNHTVRTGSDLTGSLVTNAQGVTTDINNTHFHGGYRDIQTDGGAVSNSGVMNISGADNKAISVTYDAQGNKVFNYDTSKFDTSYQHFSVQGNGGAIENTGTLTINNVLFGGESSTDGNKAANLGGASGFGGAIDSNTPNGTLKISNSVFMNNTTDAFAGAVSNRDGIAIIENSIFEKNVAQKTGESVGVGGAVLNGDTMTVTNSYFHENKAGNYGGAIANALTTSGSAEDTSNTLTINSSVFDNNTATNGGGAIYNAGSTDLNVTNRLFVNGSVFKNNKADGASSIGGAIYNSVPTSPGGNVSVATINGSTFTGNVASTAGGAIANSGKMEIYNSKFDANGTDGNITTNVGGAIRNYQSGITSNRDATVLVSNSTFTNNVAQSFGGAVYNASVAGEDHKSVATIENSVMIGNTTTSGTVVSGGAIYGGKDSITNITATNGGKTTIGETLYGSRPDGYNESTDTISFVGNAIGNFNAAEGGVIELNTVVRGDAGTADSAINVNQGNSTGLVHVKGDGGAIQNANIHLYNGELKFDHDKSLDKTNNVYLHGGLLNLLNNEYGSNQIQAQSLHLMGDSHVKLDVDLGGKYSQSGDPEMDALLKANIGTVTNDGGHTLFIDQMKSVSEAKGDSVRVLFTDADALIGHVQLSKGANIVEAPIHKYEVKQETVPVPPVGGGGSSAGVDPGEYFVFNKIGDSDSVVTAPVAAQAAFLIQDNLYRQSFANMDMVALMTPEQRMAWKMRNRYASAYHTGVFAPNIIPEERDGFYIRPFANFENVPLKNGPRVSNVSYGTLIGGESDLIDLGHGWDGNFSFFGAYHGSHQAYNGVDIWQNGGTIGGVATAYKGNFWTGVTANIGASAAQSSHTFGNDDFPILMTGAAWKSGYNWGLFNNKMVIQPSYMMSYTFVNVFDYTNAAGVKITQDPLHAIEIIPGLRIIGNLKNGWQPYLGVNMTWNIMDKTKFYANDVALTELSIKPYIEYGLGIQKRYGDRFTGFGQAMIRNGGRNGVAFTLGMRWALGH